MVLTKKQLNKVMMVKEELINNSYSLKDDINEMGLSVYAINDLCEYILYFENNHLFLKMEFNNEKKISLHIENIHKLKVFKIKGLTLQINDLILNY